MIPSETRHFAMLNLAIAMNEPDEAVLDRQRTEWLEHLAMMHRYQGPQPEPSLRERLLKADGTPV